MNALRDIHLPSHAVSSWPLAPGWWIVAVITLALMVLVLRFAIRWQQQRRQQKKYQQLLTSAISELETIRQRYQQDQQAGQACAEVSRLLRRACLLIAPATEFAALHGQPWQDYLNSHAPWPKQAAKILQQGCYHPHYQASSRDIIRMLDACESWLRAALRSH